MERKDHVEWSPTGTMQMVCAPKLTDATDEVGLAHVGSSHAGWGTAQRARLSTTLDQHAIWSAGLATWLEAQLDEYRANLLGLYLHPSSASARWLRQLRQQHLLPPLAAMPERIDRAVAWASRQSGIDWDVVVGSNPQGRRSELEKVLDDALSAVTNKRLRRGRTRLSLREDLERRLRDRLSAEVAGADVRDALVATIIQIASTRESADQSPDRAG